MKVTIPRNVVHTDWFNPAPPKAALPYSLRLSNFAEAMQDVYDFFYEVNNLLLRNGLQRLDDMLRPAAMSGIISDMLTARLAHHTRSLTENRHFNGHPDLLVKGYYPHDDVLSGREGVEIKSTTKRGGAVDCHSARDQNLCVFTYAVDATTQPEHARAPMTFTEVYLAPVLEADFRLNGRGKRGTRTATLDRAGLAKFRQFWLYRMPESYLTSP